MMMVIVFVFHALPFPLSTIEHLLPLFLTQLKDEVIFILFFYKHFISLFSVLK